MVSKDVSLYVNREEMYVLVSNLLKNAITYNKKKWKVDISFKNNSLIITDTGLWIPQEELEKIFERFYQGVSARSNEGFGIWLSLVKKIVDANGWKIEVKSTKGEGTEFRVMF
jgi:two-component system phosphate regulon sensor histidine kinase PhoR